MEPTIYILHFDKKLHHAQHYVGITTDIIGRLSRHREGLGACITAAVRAEGGNFRVGALATIITPDLTARQIERALKALKNARKFCEICHPLTAKRIPGTRPQQIPPYLKERENDEL